MNPPHRSDCLFVKTLSQERTRLKTRTIQVNSQSITVHESEGRGCAIVLVHGNSSSGLTFRQQLDSPLGNDHRMVAIDLPGHGDSNRALDPGSRAGLRRAAERSVAAAGGGPLTVAMGVLTAR